MEELIEFKKALNLVHQKYKEMMVLSEKELLFLLLESMVTLKWPGGKGLNLDYRPKGMEEKIEKILVVQLSAIGDVVLSTPTIRGLREKYPKGKIVYLAEEASSEIVLGNSNLDEVVIFKREGYVQDLKETGGLSEVVNRLRNFISSLREKGFDWVLNLNPTPRSAFLTHLIGARNTTGLTVDETARPFLNGNIWTLYKYRYFMSGKEFIEEFGRLNLSEINLGMAGVDPSKREITIFIDKDEQREGERFFEDHKIEKDDLLIGLNPGSNLESKRWPANKFARLGDALIKEYRAKIIIFGGPAEDSLVSGIVAMMKNKPIVDVPCRTTLKTLAVLLGRCDHLITNDTGPMHIAAAMHTPIITICGPTRIGAYGGDGHIQIQADLDCVGCSPASACPSRECMERISVEAVRVALRFQRGEVEELPEMPGINLYTSGRDIPGRLFSYRNLSDIGKDGLIDGILGVIELNLWMNEDLKFGYFQKPITWRELEERLLLEYEPREINQGLKICLDEIEDYGTFCDRVISETEYIKRELDVEEIIRRIEVIDRKDKEKRIAKNLVFLEYLIPKPNPEVRDIIDWHISLYQAKKEAARYLCQFLETGKWLTGEW